MKKFIAPLIFGVLMLAALSAYLFIFVEIFQNTIAVIIYVLAVGALTAAMVVTLVRRYREIKEQEKDDLSKY